MKKIIFSLVAVMMTAGASAHDSARVKKAPEEMANKKADKLKSELSLSEDQRARVYVVVLEKINKTHAIKEKYKGGKDKKAMRTEIKTANANFDSSMKGILTAEQYTKWQDIRKQQKEKHKGKKGKE